MKIAIVSALGYASDGGPFAVVREHARLLSEAGHSVSVLTRDDGRASNDLNDGPGEWRRLTLGFPRRWYRMPNAPELLGRYVSSCEAIHAHMLWDHPVLIALRLAVHQGKPIVVTPHGSLIDAHRRNALHKRAYLRFALRSLLGSRNVVIQALSAHEAARIKEVLPQAQVVVVPNPLPDAMLRQEDVHSCEETERSSPPYFLYLGRIAREKNLPLAIKAFARFNAARGGRWRLVLAGVDYRGHAQSIRALIRVLSVDADVSLVGPVYGDHKIRLIDGAVGMISSSRSEALSISLLEGAARMRPSVYTTGCHMPEIARYGGGIEVPEDEEQLAKGMGIVAEMSSTERLNMGRLARDYVARACAASHVREQLLRLYRGNFDAGILESTG